MLVRLEDFLNEDMQKTIEQLGGDLKEARFKMTLQPVADLPETGAGGRGRAAAHDRRLAGQRGHAAG